MSPKKHRHHEEIELEYKEPTHRSADSDSASSDTPAIEYEEVPPRVDESQHSEIRSSSFKSSSRSKKRRCTCCDDVTKDDVKNWGLLVCCLLVLYGVNALLFYAFMAAMMDDALVTLECYVAFWLANMAIIIGMVVYGAKTDQLSKYEKKVQLSRGEVPVDSA